MFKHLFAAQSAVISCAAEKLSAIELIHLPEVQHFVELEVIGKPDYYADQRVNPAGFFPRTRQGL
ncbi:hypothetical protein HA50_01005 [Pantoea cypripedii]|uniref:Uncharacterized protein n=1 Tax=Pantoea cypripedii TaxID=55209 RepID=A0A1X1EPY4_PANCY|nr:hypothetical protein HA50_01005 [Pantoea cypripedii]